jgi:hypothetical protein
VDVPADAVKSKERKVCGNCGCAYDLVVMGVFPGPVFVYTCRDCLRKQRRGW